MLNAEEASYKAWQNSNGKTVVFIPMVHIGRASFYEDVREYISRFKSEGFIAFYEYVKRDSLSTLTLSNDDRKMYRQKSGQPNLPDDSLALLVHKLKIKRMLRVLPDSSAYSSLVKQLPIKGEIIFQPSYPSLGIGDDDVNVDLKLSELIAAYERQFGPIELEQIDFATPMNEPLPAHRKLKGSNTRAAILDERDINLATTIHQSSNQKILVIYGLEHMKGSFEKLRTLDGSWKEIKL